MLSNNYHYLIFLKQLDEREQDAERAARKTRAEI
jgi:hypothetical protein